MRNFRVAFGHAAFAFTKPATKKSNKQASKQGRKKANIHDLLAASLYPSWQNNMKKTLVWLGPLHANWMLYSRTEPSC